MDFICLPKRITYRNIDEVLVQVTDVYLSNNRKIYFDFRQLEFITVYAMTTLLIFMWHLRINHRKEIYIQLSSGARLKPSHFILSRLGFFHQLPTSTTCYPYKPKKGTSKFRQNKAILEILPINKNQDPVPIIEAARDAIKTNTQYEPDQILDICSMIAELLHNIVDHSETDNPGYIAIQNYSNYKHMQLVIGDGGLGIPTTIRSIQDEGFSEYNDVETLKQAVRIGVSRYGKDAKRGEGLPECIRLAQKHGARFYIRSDTGYLTLTPGIGAIKTGTVGSLCGTQVLLNFPSR